MTNRSAKGGARSSLHYRGEGDLIHPPHQGVCGRHGMEDQCVTLGDLGGSAGGAAATDPISESEVGRDAAPAGERVVWFKALRGMIEVDQPQHLCRRRGRYDVAR